MTILTDPITKHKKCSKSLMEKLERLGIFTLQDLLLHLPLHYQDRTHVMAINDLEVGEKAVVEGVIIDIQLQKRGRQSLIVVIEDATEQMTLRFFHYRPAQLNGFQTGARLWCFGEVRHGWRGGYEMVHPEYRFLFPGNFPIKMKETLTPVYPTTEGLRQHSLRTLMDFALQKVTEDTVPDFLPESLRQSHQLPHLADALKFVHQPPPEASCQILEERQHPAQKRLVFEEFLAHQLSLQRLKKVSQKRAAPSTSKVFSNQHHFLQQIGFAFTQAQQRVIQEISEDLTKPVPMMRLVQGDVGSGKTVVAALAMLQMQNASFQTVLMAPTDLLAEQHYYNLRRWFTPLGLSVAWLAGKHKGKVRKETLAEIAEAKTLLAVGTHALFQEGVQFQRLGLVIVDEQHRFGVHQRLALHEKGIHNGFYPHQLVLTATPIPRTLAMTFYADLDLSIIDELPPGRKPIKTVVIANTKRSEVIERVRSVCSQGRQVYWVCTLIEESEQIEGQAAEALATELRAHLAEFRVGLLHGRIKSQEKEEIMQAFKTHQLDILVATAVIEVGVDVPNASLMIIENAERLGLSQLHQLRGRVGRGSEESFCVLLYQQPLSPLAAQRLQAIRETQDGFEIACYDLRIRGPGELLGARQTGAVVFRIAELFRDQALLPLVQQIAEQILGEYPHIVDPIVTRWIPQGETYGKV